MRMIPDEQQRVRNDANMTTEQTTPLIGGRYQTGEMLGQGGMGRVYRAYDRLEGREVALKQVLFESAALEFATMLSPSKNPNLALANEFETLSSLRHPHIINVLDYGFADGLPYFTMTLLQEPQTILEYGRHQPLETQIESVLQLLQALAYLHRRDLYHRDLKPGNVLVEGDHTYVLDFGLAVSKEANPGAELVGTLAYMAPEVMQNAPHSAQSDLYAVGIILYELIGGVHPHRGEDVTELIENTLTRPVDLDVLSVTDALRVVIAQLLAKSPDERYLSADDVITALCDAAGLDLPAETDEIRESYLQAATFIGREIEQQMLQGALRHIVAPPQKTANGDDPASVSGSGWLVGGESGVGKSRLIHEVETQARVEGVLVLRGQAVSEGRRAYQLWHDVLRQLALYTPLKPDEILTLKSVVTDIDTLLDVALDAKPDAAAAKTHLPIMAENVFSRVLANTPIFVILEDLQWAEEESLVLLTQLANVPSYAPMMIVGTYRNDETPNLPERFPTMRTIQLDRLTDTEITRLSVSMLGENGQLPEVVDLLQRETEGNVFFLVEVVRALAEDVGNLREVGAATLPEHVFSGGVMAIVQRRLNLIPGWAREALDVAAVIGRQLDRDVMAHIYPDLDLERWGQVCVNSAVLDAEDRFAHDKLREYALALISEGRKVVLNETIAKAIEAVYGDDLTPYARRLYTHWAAAQNREKQGYYAYLAGVESEKYGQFADSYSLLRRALELEMYAYQENPAKAEADLYHHLGGACYGLSNYQEAYTWQEKALPLYEQLNDLEGMGDCYNSLGELNLRQSRYDTARDLLVRGLEIRQSLGLHKAVAYSYMTLGVVYVYDGSDLEIARDHFRKCYKIMKEVGDPISIAQSLNNLASITDMIGEVDEARKLHYQALKIREDLNHRRGIAYSLNNIGILEKEQGNLETGRDYLMRGLDLTRRFIGEKLSISISLEHLGDIERQLGNYDGAESLLNECLAYRREYDDKGGVAQALNNLSDVAADRGEYETAYGYIREALQTALEIDHKMEILASIRRYAQLLIAQNKPQDAYPLLVFINHATERTHLHTHDQLAELNELFTPAMQEVLTAQGQALTLDEAVAAVLGS